jgi:PAS domain S-box-containing protein
MTMIEDIAIAGSDILIVDDTKANLDLLIEILAAAGYNIRPATTGTLAIRSVMAKLPALILLDVKLPDMDGYEVCRRLKALDHTRAVPVIFISVLEDESSKIKSFQAGGIDFITKPFYAEELLVRVKTHIALRQIQRSLEIRNNDLLREIAEREKTELALKESEFFFRESQRAASVGSYKINFITDSWDSSEVLNHIFGIESSYDRSVQGLIGLVHPGDREMITHYLLKHVLTEHQPFNKEFRIINKSNSETRWVNCLGAVALDDNENVASMIGTIQDISERKIADEKIAAYNEKLRDMNDHLQTIRDDERKNMARDIHDLIGTNIAGLKMYLKILEKNMPPNFLDDHPVIMDNLESMAHMIDDTFNLVRGLIRQLRSVVLDELGLAEAILSYSDEMKKKSNIGFKIDIIPKEFSLNTKVSNELYLMFIEILTNVIRHSGATSVAIFIRKKNHKFEMRIEDNGIGITEQKMMHKNKFGIQGMKERISLLDGKIEIAGNPGKGTTVSIEIPV